MKEDRPHLYFGGQAADFEDILVGNREGLEKLKVAIDEAIENGESSLSVGEFIGVKCAPTDAFTNTVKLENTTGSKIGFWLIGLCFVFTVFIVWLARN